MQTLQTVKRKIHWRLLVASFLFVLHAFSSQLVWAQAVLENPQPGSFQSGVGVISGFVYTATAIEIEIDGGAVFEAAYGSSRGGTAGPCGDDGLNGFGLLFNWSLLGDGTHQIRALADGQEFATVSFVVATFGEEFLRDAAGQFTFSGFPNPGDEVRLVWQESVQNFVVTSEDVALGALKATGDGVLENPLPSSFQSGVGIISGWACEANKLEIQIDDGALFEAAYGTSREDTRVVCGDANNGFGLTFNWNLLEDGEHTIRALADGVEFGSATFQVATFGVEFLTDVSGNFSIPDFPQLETDVRVRWQQSLQNFVVESVTELDPDSNRGLCRTQDGTGFDDLGQIAVFSYFNPCLLNGQTLLFEVTVPIQQGLAKADGFSARTDSLSFRQGGQTFTAADFRWVDTAGNTVNTDIAAGNTLNTLLTVNSSSALNFNEPFEILYTQAMVAEFTIGVPCTPEPTNMDITFGDIILCQIDVVGDLDIFQFSGSVGDRIVIQASRLAGGNALMELRGPDGNRVGNQAFGGITAVLEVSLEQDGLHTIIVRERDLDATLDYVLHLERIVPTSPTARSIQFGIPLEDRIDPIGDLDIFQFSGSIGDRIVIQASRLAGGNALMELRGPDRNRVGNQAFGGITAVLEVSLEQDGLHTIIVRERDLDATLDYVLHLERVFPTSPTARLIQFGIPLEGQIDPIGDLDIFQFSGSVGDRIVIQASRLAGGNALMELRGPDGNRVGNQAFGGITAVLEVSLEQDGLHTIIVRERDLDATLDYVLNIQCIIGSCF